MLELAADRSNVVATAKSDWTATGQISVLFLFFYKQGPFKKNLCEPCPSLTFPPRQIEGPGPLAHKIHVHTQIISYTE